MNPRILCFSLALIFIPCLSHCLHGDSHLKVKEENLMQLAKKVIKFLAARNNALLQRPKPTNAPNKVKVDSKIADITSTANLTVDNATAAPNDAEDDNVKKYEGCILEETQMVFGVLPGMSWDDLRQVEKVRAVQLNYKDCYFTEDGNYLIPNGVVVLPEKQSTLSTKSQIVESFASVSSESSLSVEPEVGLGAEGVDVKVAYGRDEEKSCRTQRTTRNSIIRSQIDYFIYTVILQPGTALSPELQSRLLEIGEEISVRLMSTTGYQQPMPYVDYLAECVVRDFGTHYIFHLTVGGKLDKLDFIKSQEDLTEEQKTIVNQGKLKGSFEGIANAAVGFKHEASNASSQTLSKTFTNSNIFTKGGLPYTPDFEVSDWEASLPNNLAVIKRRGRPLETLISKVTLPTLSDAVLYTLRERIKTAVALYQEKNTHSGCMDLLSPNFDLSANVHDPSKCKDIIQDYGIGGFYQTCDGCPPDKSVNVINPLTGWSSCPSGSNERVLMSASVCQHGCQLYKHVNRQNDGRLYQQKCDRKCGTVRAHWCFVTSRVNYTLQFGGLHSREKGVANVFTRNFQCPLGFSSYPFGESSTICLGPGLKGFRISFGGFFSCTEKNPYSDNSFGCPEGYSPYKGTTESDCLITFCLRSADITSKRSPRLLTPPFTELDEESIENLFKQKELLLSGELKNADNGWYKTAKNQWRFNAAQAKTSSDIVAEEFDQVLIK